MLILWGYVTTAFQWNLSMQVRTCLSCSAVMLQTSLSVEMIHSNPIFSSLYNIFIFNFFTTFYSIQCVSFKYSLLWSFTNINIADLIMFIYEYKQFCLSNYAIWVFWFFWFKLSRKGKWEKETLTHTFRSLVSHLRWGVAPSTWKYY